MVAPLLRHLSVQQHRMYLGVSALRRMRLSPGSPVLEAVLAALPDLLARWTPDDLGVDEQGMYELVIACDLGQGDGHLLGEEPAEGRAGVSPLLLLT